MERMKPQVRGNENSIIIMEQLHNINILNFRLIWCALRAEHHFFGTSRRKSPCDGIGGTIKREAADATWRAAVKSDFDTRTAFSLG